MNYVLRQRIRKTNKENYKKEILLFVEKKMKTKCISLRMPIITCQNLNNNVNKKNKRGRLYRGRPSKKSCTTSQ